MMGDSRANIKIDFEIYGEKFKYDGWINWTVGTGDIYEIDRRITEFFVDSYLEALLKYEDEEEKRLRKEKDKDHERYERQILSQLKAKYEER